MNNTFSPKSNAAAAWHFLQNGILMRMPVGSLRYLAAKSLFRKVGQGAYFGYGCSFLKPSNIEVGSHSFINSRAHLDGRGGLLQIGNNVDVAADVNIWTLDHDPHDDYHSARGRDVTIEDYVWIASRATILPGLRIGRGAVVATGSVVSKNVAPMAIVGGIPARQIGTRRSQLKYTINYRPGIF